MDRFVKASEVYETVKLNFKGSEYASILFTTKIKGISIEKGSTIDTVGYKINGGSTIADLTALQAAINATTGSFELQIIVSYVDENAEGTLNFKHSYFG